MLKIINKVKGPRKIVIVTNAMWAAGKPSSESILGNKHNGVKIIVEDYVARPPDRNAFSGSVTTANRLVQNMTLFADVPLLDAALMMSKTLAKIMRIQDRKGSLVAGKDAAILIFDQRRYNTLDCLFFLYCGLMVRVRIAL